MTQPTAIKPQIEPNAPSRIRQQPMFRAPRSPHSEVIRRWLIRLRKALPRPLTFECHQPKEQEALCLREYFKFTRFPSTAPLSWEKLDHYVGIASRVEDPHGGLLELPDTRPLQCLRKLSDLCGFSELEHHVLVWAYLIGFEESLIFINAGIKNYRRLELVTLLAKTLGVDPGDLEDVLRPDSPLALSGLLVVDLSGDWVEWLDLSLPVRHGLYMPPDDPMHLLRGSLDRAPVPTLSGADFPHLAPQIEILTAYLRAARAANQKGVNILFHGPPGTGKTELAGVMAGMLGLRLYGVALTDCGGDPRKALGRLHAFSTAQMVLRNAEDALLLFDEMESSFAASGESRDPSLAGLKGWLNRSLETNPVPCLWCTNAVEDLDPAFVRRFDLALEIGVPPRKVRRAILDRHLGDLPVGQEVRNHLAGHEALPPAVVGRSARVIALAGAGVPGLDFDLAFTDLVNQSLQAMGWKALKPRTLTEELPYSLDHLQADKCLHEVVEGFKRSPRGRLCLYGPPGTGKTAFGHHLAEALDRPLLIKRASDLQSKWLGEMEQNLGRMFMQAEREGAVLLLDEADTFLRDRNGAERSWEVSQVAELLTQMEAYAGVFVASTNLMDALDAAALRRFDLKIHFGFLRPPQALAMFNEVSRTLGLEPSPPALSIMQGMTTLTPGDFANIVRQSRLAPIWSEAELVARLQAECRLKPNGRRRTVGF